VFSAPGVATACLVAEIQDEREAMLRMSLVQRGMRNVLYNELVGIGEVASSAEVIHPLAVGGWVGEVLLALGWSRFKFCLASDCRKVAGSSSDEVHFFPPNLPNPSSRTMALGSAKPLAEMSTRGLPEG
jgi:hypothetical protein